MKHTKIYDFTVPANGSKELLTSGAFFKILSSTGNVNVVGEGLQMDNVGTGQGLQNHEFNRLMFTDRSGGTNTLRVIVGDADFIDSLNGSVAVTSLPNQPMSPTFTAATVTNASTTIKAANANAKYFNIQNNHATGNIWITTAATATATNGVKITPGGSYEVEKGIATAVQAIGDVASNTVIIVVEG